MTNKVVKTNYVRNRPNYFRNNDYKDYNQIIQN